MSVTVVQLPGEPIVLATISGRFSPDDLQTVLQRTSALCSEITPHAHRVLDLRSAHTTLSDMILMIRASAHSTPGTLIDPDLHTILVGRSQFTQILVDALRQPQYGGVTIPLYQTLADALNTIRSCNCSLPCK